MRRMAELLSGRLPTRMLIIQPVGDRILPHARPEWAEKVTSG